MNILHLLDTHFLLMLVSILTIFTLFYYSSLRRQKQFIEKSETTVKNQEILIYQVNSVLVELRKMNHLIGELVGIEPPTDNRFSDTISQLTHEPNLNSTSNNNPSLHKLYVGNIDYAATENDLAQHFSRFGQVELVNIPINRYTGRARGFGFVSYKSRTEAEKAMTLNGSEFKGRQIQVNFAKERGPV